MTDRTVAIKITSDGKAFVVDQQANAQAVQGLSAAMDDANKKAAALGDRAGVLARQNAGMAETSKQVAAAIKDQGYAAQVLAERELAAADAADKFMFKLQQQVDAVGKTKAELLAMQAATHGLSDAAAPLIAQLDGVAAGHDKAAGAAGKSAFATAQARRQLIVLGHEAVTGNFARMPGSFMVLAERTGAALPPLNALTVGIGAAAAILGVLAIAAYKGAEESKRFNEILVETGGYAALTAGRFDAMSASIATAANVGIGKGRAALLDLSATGRLTGDVLELLSKDAIRTSDLTGAKLEAVGKEYAKMADGVAAWAEEHNKSMHFMSLAQYEYIKALEEQGNKQAAMLEVAKLLDAQLDHQQKPLGLLQTAWHGLGVAASATWDFMLDVGRAQSLDSKLANATNAVENARRRLNPNLPASNAYSGQSGVDQALATQGALQSDVIERKRQVDHAAEMARINEEGITAVHWINEKILGYDKTAAVQKELDAAQRQFAAAEAAGHAVSIKDQQIIIDGIQSQIKERKALKDTSNPFAGEQEAAKEWAKFYLDAIKLTEDATAKIDNLLPAQKKLLEYLSSPAYKTNSEDMRQLALSALYVATAKEQEAQADADEEKQMRGNIDANARYFDGLVKQTDQLQADLEKQLDHNATIGKSKEEIGALTEARLLDQAAQKDSLALVYDLIDVTGQFSTVVRAQAQILRDRAAAARDGGIAQQAADGAKKAEEAWTRSEHSIEEGLYSALADGSERGVQKMEHDLKNWALHFVLQIPVQMIGQFGASLLNPSAASAAGNGLSAFGSGSQLLAGTSLANTFGTSVANVTGTGLDGFLATNGAFGTASGAAGLMGTIGTALPYIGVALALASIFGGSGGGPKTEGGFSAGFDLRGIDAGGSLQGSQRGDVAGAQQLAAGITSAIDQAGTAFGIRLADQVGVFFAKDPQGNSNTQLQVVSANYNRSNAAGGIENVGRSDQEFTDAVSLAAAQDVLAQLQAAAHSGALGGKVGDFVAAIDKTGSADAINNAIKLAENAQALYTAFGRLGPAFQSMVDLSVEEIGKLVDAGGGMEKFSAELAGYYDNFYSDAEKRANSVKAITDTLNAAGLSVTAQQVGSATRDQFRALMEQEVALGEAGRPAVQALLSVEAAFAAITPAADAAAAAVTSAADAMAANFSTSAQIQADLTAASDALAAARQRETATIQTSVSALTSSIEHFKELAGQLRDFRDSLLFGDLSPLTPAQKYAQAQSLFESTYSAAQSGDPDAMARLQTVSQDFLQASQTYNASSTQYLADFARVQTALTLSATKADAMATFAQQQLDVANQQLVALNTVNQSVLSVDQAIAQLAQAVGAALAAGLNPGAGNLSALTGGVTGQWVDTQVGQVYASAGGAAATGGTIYAINGATYTLQAMIDYINGLLAQNRELDAYYAFKTAGISLSDADKLMSWPALTAEDWAVAHNLQVFATGAMFDSGVVTRPTLFNIGQMGERTPEAILPLANVGGQLGVRAVGGGNSELASSMRETAAQLKSIADGQMKAANMLAAVIAKANATAAAAIVAGTANASQRAVFNRQQAWEAKPA